MTDDHLEAQEILYMIILEQHYLRRLDEQRHDAEYRIQGLEEQLNAIKQQLTLDTN